MDIESALFKTKKEDYGNNYETHYFEQYKLFVEMADRISSRRHSANSFFLSVNTAVIAIIGYIQLAHAGTSNAGTSSTYYWLVSIAGIALCVIWLALIKSYKDLNRGKFQVVHVLEQRLPVSPYDAEWVVVGEGKSLIKYIPFTIVEMAVPVVFIVLYSGVCYYLT